MMATIYSAGGVRWDSTTPLQNESASFQLVETAIATAHRCAEEKN